MNKVRVGIIFGGKSAEHEVSLQSAKNVVDAINSDKYEVVLIGIDKNGGWHITKDENFLLNSHDPKHISINTTVQTDDNISSSFVSKVLYPLKAERKIDVVFPILHGPFGEDGTMQGLLKLAGVPFVGSGVLGSAVGMDKDVSKRLLRDAGIPIADFLVYSSEERESISFEHVKEHLGLPCFIKPANMGSSVGVHKVKDEKQFWEAVEAAFDYDRKILIEEFIQGREIECAVLGNYEPIASTIGEIIPQQEFYSYEAKYIDENGAVLQIPADISEELREQARALAIKTFKTLGCEGMARVDFFLTDRNKLLVNEINTIPGFTKISMYPKLWEVSGISYSDLIDRLIQLALERHEKETRLRTVL